MSPAPLRSAGTRRAMGCTLSILFGLAAATLLLLLAGRPALAAGSVLPYPGAFPCNTSLQACVDGASPDDTIVITAGTYITGLTLSQPVSLTGVASNTVILQALPNQRVLTVTSNAVNSSVIISGLTFTGGDVTGAGPYPANCGGGIYLDLNDTPLFVNVIITNNIAGSGGGLCAANGASLRMTGSQVLSNTAASGDGGGGMRVIDTVDISGSLFQDNQCLKSNCFGGGLLSFFNPLAITGTTFISNSADGAGGGLYNYKSATLSGGLFLHNQCAYTGGCNGGGLYAAGTLTLSGTSFISNIAHFEGGALVLKTGQITNALFQENACSESSTCWGGGLFAITHTTLSGAQFLSNTAQSRAGAAFFNSGADVSSSQFLNNSCTQTDCLGGALLANDTLLLTDTTFMTNAAPGGNGALYAAGVTTITRGRFQNNRCTVDGCQAGAVRAEQLTVTGTQFLTNTARDGGGAVVAGGAAALTNALFQGNTCTQTNCGGGGLLAASTLALTGTNFISNSALGKGGGVYGASAAARLSGGLFQRNTCTADGCQGGGVSVDGPLTVNGTQWLTNTARFYGGGAYAGGAAALTGGVFQGNTCTQTDCQGGGLLVFAGSPVTLTNMQILSNTAVGQGGGVRAGGSAALTGGLFQNNRCTQSTCTGGGLATVGGLTLSGTQFVSNQSQLNGAGATAGGATALTGGLFQNNQCALDTCSGGGLMAGADVMVSGTQFLSNSTHFQGGGLYVSGALTLTGGLVQGNACSQTNCRGGGLYTLGSLALTDTVFNNNSARLDGGGLLAVGNAALAGGSFQGNACTQDNCRGGGLYASHNLSLTGTAFLSNSARFSGGGAVANAGGAAVLNNALFLGNQCTQSGCQGGGLYTLGSLALTRTRFIDNHALLGGGGGLQTAGPTTVFDGVFTGNRAFQGGGLYHNGGTGAVVNSLFADNVASSGGAALYLNATSGQFNLLFDTIAFSYTTSITPAVNVFNGSVGITDTIIANHNVGIQRDGGTVYEDYNLFSLVNFSTSGSVAGGAHIRIGVGDPVFYSPSVFNYHLWPGALAVDAGVDAGVYVDFEGDTRPQNGGFDIGYDEIWVSRQYLPLIRR